MLGKMVTVLIDRPLGSAHPCDSKCIYPLNYGFVPGVLGGDGEEQDAYVMGATEQISRFYGRVIAIIHRLNDNEDKWVVAPDGMHFTEDEIRHATHFMEQFFKSEITLWHEGSEAECRK